MRIFVGTLYSGEMEFEECLTSIRNQTYKNFEHYIFKNLPNKEAHSTLFKRFLEKAIEFEILIKIDADMVLCSEYLFENVVSKLNQNPDLDIYTIAVYDFFSGQLINGLNTYRNTVRWNFNKETMFVDIPEVPSERAFYDQIELAPAAIHCKNPSPYQAFHYGVHRGLKSIQKIHSTTHWALLEKTWQNFLRIKDPRIGLAILGSELVYAGRLTKEDVDYTNPRLKAMLENYQAIGSDEIEHEIKILRLNNLGFLPGDMRRRFLRLIRK